eukprot:SAG11_NODE_636_length_8034_cov_5.199118_9_plen_134_part_00
MPCKQPRGAGPRGRTKPAAFLKLSMVRDLAIEVAARQRVEAVEDGVRDGSILKVALSELDADVDDTATIRLLLIRGGIDAEVGRRDEDVRQHLRREEGAAPAGSAAHVHCIGCSIAVAQEPQPKRLASVHHLP